MPSCSRAEFACLMSHGWLTARCPCYPFPQQQRPKTYRSTSTSTESTPGGAAVIRLSSVSSDPAICSRSALVEPSQECDESKCAAVISLKKERAIQPCSSAICLPVATPSAKAAKPDCFRCMMGKREASKRASGGGGCKGKVGKAYVNFGEALVPCAFIVPSRPLPDLPAKRQIPTSTSIDLIDLTDDRYSNFNPGYKSTSPPEEELLVCPRSFCHHLSDVIVPSLPILNELTEVFYEDLPGPLVQCQALSLGNLDCKAIADKRHPRMVRASWAGPSTARASPPPPPPPPKTKLDSQGHETTRYHRETQSPQSPKFDEMSKRCRSQISKHPFEHVLLAGRSRVAPPARSSRGSWLLSASSPPLSSDASCKTSSSDPHFYWELEFTSTKSSGCTVEKAHEGAPKAVRERSASVTPPPICNCYQPAMAGVSPLLVGGVDKAHSPQLDQKQCVPSVPYRLHKSQTPVDLKTCKTPVVRHQKQTPAATEENPEGAKGSSASRTSADVLTPPSRDNKSSKQRCPTPPRVLSPGLGTIMCEDIAQI